MSTAGGEYSYSRVQLTVRVNTIFMSKANSQYSYSRLQLAASIQLNSNKVHSHTPSLGAWRMEPRPASGVRVSGTGIWVVDHTIIRKVVTTEEHYEPKRKGTQSPVAHSCKLMRHG
eukprot:6633563-Prymnesium_polylepis.1